MGGTMGLEGFMQPPSPPRARFVVVTLLVAAAAAVPALAQTASWPAGSDEPIAANPPIVPPEIAESPDRNAEES